MRYLVCVLILSICATGTPDSVLGQSPSTAQVHAALVPPLTRVRARADSRLWLEGSSNVRDWTCKAIEMDASFDLSAARSGRSSSEPRAVRGVTVKVPVRMLKCGDRHMEANLYKALKSPKPPAESFITAEFERLPGASASSAMVEITGRLTIAGIERSVKMSVMSDRMPDGTHRARGTVPILMTDFGITPPRPWGGILRTADKVLIQFEVFVGIPTTNQP